MDLLRTLWLTSGGGEDALERVRLTGDGNGLPSSFAVGALARSSIAASALAASGLWHLRGGPEAGVEVPLEAAVAAFRSERLLTVGGKPARDPWDPIAGNYPAADGRWLRLHTNFPHHRDGVLAMLGCANDRDAVAAALAEVDAPAFEQDAARRGLCVAMLRSMAEWDAHPQAAELARHPMVEITRIGDAPPEPLADAERPLGGVRVLDLTRIIAGPVATRELASHGAEVLHVTAPHLPSIEGLVIDTGRGKRATHLDLRDPDQSATFGRLLAEADVMVQGYRPGAIVALGYGAEAAARIRPGIVHAELSAYGESGLWGGRRGFDSLVQMVSGINRAEADAAGEVAPKPLPCQALDHAAGYLLAFGIQRALARRAVEGGSWQVRVSLARTAQVLRDLGPVENGLATPEPDLTPYLEAVDSPFGAIRAAAPAARIEGAMPHYILPPVPLGTHAPEWQAR